MKPQQTRLAGWRRTALWSSLLAIMALAAGLLTEQMARWSATASVASLTSPTAAMSPDLAVARTPINAAFAKLPLIFEANQGQTDPQVRFVSRGLGYTLFLTPDEAVFNFRTRSVAEQEPAAVKLSTLRMRLLDANSQPGINGLDALATRINYYRGNDPDQWQIGVATYAKVQLQSVYPGIDLIYYGNQRQLEYDFVVAPGADPGRIRLALAGLDEAVQATLADNGDLVLSMAVGEMRWHKPVVYQDIAGQRQPVDGRFVLNPTEKDKPIELGFAIAAYDHSQPLIIDPVLAYSTFLGGMLDDYATGIAVDKTGSIYVTGATASVNFPGNARNPSFTKLDVFVAKFNVVSTDAYTMKCSSVLSGAGKSDAPEDKDDIASAITLDSKREGTALYITGTTASSVFPKCELIFPSKTPTTSLNGSTDAFVVQINPTTCVLMAATCLGGGKDESGTGIAVDNLENIYVTGYTNSSYSSTNALAAFRTVRPYQPLLAGGLDAFVTKYSAPVGPAWNIAYSTYFGGTKDDKGTGIAVDPDRNVYITGSTSSTNINTAGAFGQTLGGSSDAFVAKFNPNLKPDDPDSSLIYSTYLGGTSSESGTGIAVAVEKDSTTGKIYHYAYVTGTTDSINFPITLDSFGTVYAGNGDAFITKINPFGSMLDYSTYLGGSGADSGAAIVLESNAATGETRYVYITGATASNNFPVISGAFDTMLGGTRDAFMAQIDMKAVNLNKQQLLYSTYLGGSNNADSGAAIAIDPNPSNVATDDNYGIYVVGMTSASDFPVTSNAYDYTINGSSKDAFIAKFWSNPQNTEYTYTVTLTKAGPGKELCKTNGGGGNYHAGDIVKLDTPTLTGSLFAGWSPASCGNTFAMPANNLGCIANCINLPKNGATNATAVEYRHTGKEHYFNTANLNDISFLANNSQSGWHPTGYIFDTYPLDAAPSGTVPVARYYGGQQSDGAYKPDSHFYTGLLGERQFLDNSYSQKCPTGQGSCMGEAWHYEKDEYRVYLPSGSTCPSGSRPVYRLYNNGYPAKDSNHRYTTDLGVAADMKAQGWTDEGVKMCVP
ncbi:MAG: SBBP repeat-containing protein [Candidatus Contendobacter sp.]|nr:SBBP repeat-containing protein [Candidatus Contendobacter sp.]